MTRSPLFPNIPYLGIVAQIFIVFAISVGICVLFGGFFATLSNNNYLTLIGAVLAFGGSGKFLLTLINNIHWWLCAVTGWLILIFV